MSISHNGQERYVIDLTSCSVFRRRFHYFKWE